MAKLTKSSVIYLAEETTRGQAKASTADYLSTEVSANLLARTDGTLATIVDDGGTLYRFLGTEDEVAVDLTLEDYTNTNRWANIGSAWASTDAVLFQTTSFGSLSIEALTRENLNYSFRNCPTIAGTESNSFTGDIELGIKPVSGAEAGNLRGHYLYKNSLGAYVEKGANVDKGAGTVTEVATTTGAYDLYTGAKPDEIISTLAVRQYEGGSPDEVMDFGGLVTATSTFNVSAGQIINVSHSLEGTETFINTTTQPTPPTISCGEQPMVAKRLGFRVDGNTYEVSDLTLTVTNTLNDRQFINSSGIGEKITTAKQTTVSFTRDLDTFADILRYKQNQSATVFVELVNGNGDEIIIYLPNVLTSELSRSDDAGVITQGITFEAFDDVNGRDVYIATKKGI